MSLNVLKTTNKIFEPVARGNHVARLIQIIDLGTQTVEWKGETKQQYKIRLTWELCNELKEFDGVKKPQVIGATYTLSMGSKAKLRPIIEGMLGTSLSDSEAADWGRQRFEKLLGMPCMLNVIHTEKGDKTYANIASVAPVPKGVTVPEQFNENFIFELEDKDTEIFEMLPKFLQEMVMKSEEAQPSTLTDGEKEKLEKLRGGYNHHEKNDYTDGETFSESEQLAAEIPF